MSFEQGRNGPFVTQYDKLVVLLKQKYYIKNYDIETFLVFCKKLKLFLVSFKFLLRFIIILLLFLIHFSEDILLTISYSSISL